MNQYCIQQEEPSKLLAYLECFLGTTSGEASEGVAVDTKIIKSKSVAVGIINESKNYRRNWTTQSPK